MTTKRIWFPEIEDKNYSSQNRPGTGVYMLHDAFYKNATSNPAHVDKFTGVTHKFTSNVSNSGFGADQSRNLHYMWKDGLFNYAELSGKCRDPAYWSFQTGLVPTYHSLSQVQEFKQHINSGVYGFRFMYRWPQADSRNYWDVSPVIISKVMMHFYDPHDESVYSALATLGGSSGDWNFRPDVFNPDSYVGRKSDEFRGAWYRVADPDGRAEIIEKQHCWIGLSWEMSYIKYGGYIYHSRGMDIANVTPIYGVPDGVNYTPIITKPTTYPYSTQVNKREFYYVTS